MYLSKLVGEVLIKARAFAIKCKHEYVTPEHILYLLCDEKAFEEPFKACGGDVEQLRNKLKRYLKEHLEKQTESGKISESAGLKEAFMLACQQAENSGRDEVELHHVIAAIGNLKESYGAYFISEAGVDLRDLLFEMCHGNQEGSGIEKDSSSKEEQEEDESTPQEALKKISAYVSNLNDEVKSRKEPIVGREEILKRTIQVLCRLHKNNPIHIGEPGVGKTAITLGLAKLINEDKVPDLLKGSTVYALDLGAILAGTQYRGDFEKRLKKILEIIKKQEKPIIYIDEIHNIVGAGAIGAGSMDASNLLKPYLTEGKIRFIGATTYEEYKKYFEKDKALVRRFQTIEVKEPTPEETLEILKGIKKYYEAYHEVKYTDEALEGAVKLSQQYITDRFLPDKAIDLLDEAGAYNTLKKMEGKKVIKTPTITLKLIEETLSKICHIPKQTVEKNEVKVLKTLEAHLKRQIFGQDEAISQVVRHIKMSRAGLGDSNKPIASLLFVGPTGVGKTEIARCLAKELGIKLLRFDMSEYTEKHTASKLIGAPPGYVGYEEGGLMTDAVRKAPYCVLLLDEIEKAHQDIFNVLLQVMDYATLTDNKGRKADFRNIILIMTSNAGASEIGKHLVGFGERKIESGAIDAAVKRLFTPEFRNRLNGIVTFHHITPEMAKLVAKKELELFKSQLNEKNITVSFDKNCMAYIAEKGISTEFGAREIGRVIEAELKPQLVDEILFGALSAGGKCKICIVDNQFKLIIG